MLWPVYRHRSHAAARVFSVAALVVPIAQQEGCETPVQPPAQGGQLGQFSSTCDDRSPSGIGAPYRFHANVDATPGVTLIWNHEFGVNTPSSYRLDRSDDGGRSWNTIGDRFATGWKDGGGAHHRSPSTGRDYQSYLTPGGVYYYRVGAFVSSSSGRTGERLQYDCNVIGVRVR